MSEISAARSAIKAAAMVCHDAAVRMAAEGKYELANGFGVIAASIRNIRAEEFVSAEESRK
jgi:hypothetical protein